MEPVQNTHNSQLAYDDEIDLFQICADLWQKRVLITLVALAVLACGVSYAYWAPEVYKAEARLLPAPVSSLSELTAVDDLIWNDRVSPGGAFDLTNQYLASMEVKKALLNSPTIAEYIDDAFPESTERDKLASLSKRMVVLLPNIKKKRSSTEVSIEWHDPVQAAELVNTWVELAMNGARSELITNARGSLDDEIEKVSEKIKVKEALVLSQLSIELLKLADAKKIAVKNGLVDPVDLATESLVTDRSFLTNVMELRSLYLLGSKALSSEIEILEKRKEGFDKYDPALTELKEHRMSLERIVLEEGLVLTANIDARAVPPEARLKPKRTMIMLVSVFLGTMVGFFVALIVVSVEKRKAALS